MRTTNFKYQITDFNKPFLFSSKVNNSSDTFGMLMPDRHNTYGTGEQYRYAYNGMELDNEVSGNGNSYTTEFRQYDPRIARWKSLDPLMAKFPWMSPYVAFDDNPVLYIDPYGLAATNGNEPVDPVEGEPDDEKKRLPGQANENGEFNPDDYKNCPEVVVLSDPNKVPPTSPKKEYKVDIKINDKVLETKSFDSSYKRYSFIKEFNQTQKNLAVINQRKRDLEMVGNVEYPSLLPDGFSIDVNGSGTAGAGANSTLHLTWILKGKNASLYPFLTYEQTIGVGYDVSLGVGLSGYNKDRGDIKPSDFVTMVDPQSPTLLKNVSTQTSIGGSLLGKGSLNGGYTSLGEGNRITNFGFQIGASVTPGINGTTGVSNTFMLIGGGN